MRYDLTPKQIAKFHTSYTKGDGCWIWQKSKAWYGHGNFFFNCTYAGAHRIMYSLTYGDIPDGLIVRHKCDNPPCVNPDHLELGTHADNWRDCYERGRKARGERNGRAKITLEQAQEIRATYKPRHKKFGALPLSRKFGISPVMASYIGNGKNWKHIDGKGSGRKGYREGFATGLSLQGPAVPGKAPTRADTEEHQICETTQGNDRT